MVLPRWDDIVMLFTSLLVVYSIIRAIKRYNGGLSNIVKDFVSTGKNGEPLILFMLIIPTMMMVVYYSLFFVPEYSKQLELRALVFRPSLFTADVILAVYFLNGRLIRNIRSFAGWSVGLWSRLLLYFRM